MRALAEWRQRGYRAEKVEQRLPIPGKFVTRDLFGCIDLLAMKAGEPLVAVQATTRSNVNARMLKSAEMARLWVSTGNVFEIVGYDGAAARRVRMTAEGVWGTG